MSDFDKATKWVADYHTELSDEKKLMFYGLYKQATEGDAPKGKTFGVFDFKGKQKYGAWEQRRGISRDTAAQTYVVEVKTCIRELQAK